jgi:hypothetical protein
MGTSMRAAVLLLVCVVPAASWEVVHTGSPQREDSRREHKRRRLQGVGDAAYRSNEQSHAWLQSFTTGRCGAISRMFSIGRSHRHRQLCDPNTPVSPPRARVRGWPSAGLRVGPNPGFHHTKPQKRCSCRAPVDSMALLPPQ